MSATVKAYLTSLILALCLLSPAKADGIQGNGGGSGGSTPVGHKTTEIVLGNSETPAMFINFFKQAGSQNLGGSAPTILNSDQYPISQPAANLSYSMSYPQYASYTWELFWTGTTAVEFNTNAVTIVSDPGSCYNNSTHVISGLNCDLTFTLSSNGVTLNFLWPGGTGTTSNLSNMVLLRTKDKTDYLTGCGGGGCVTTPEFRSVMAGLNAPIVRTLGLTEPQQDGGGQQGINWSDWNTRTPVTAFSYITPNFLPNYYAGQDLVHTDNYVFTSYPNMPGTWTDGEQFIGYVQNAGKPYLTATGNATSDGGLVQIPLSDTSSLSNNQQVLVTSCDGNGMGKYLITVVDPTHIDLQGTTFASHWTAGGICYVVTTTVNVGGRGAKFVTGQYTYVNYYSDTNLLTGYSVFIYDALCDILVTTQAGYFINGGVPPEVQVRIANEINAALWYNIPPNFSLTSTASLISFFNSSVLAGDLYIEYNNEWFNNLFTGYDLAFARGAMIGLGPSGLPDYAYPSLRALQMFNTAVPLWTRTSSKLYKTIGVQSNATPISVTAQYNLEGISLCSSGGGCQNQNTAAYASIIGANYNTFPNRPIDVADAFSITTYWNGAQLAGGAHITSLSQIQGSCNGVTCTGLIAAGACYANPSAVTCGNGGSQNTALQAVYDDILGVSGTQGIGGSACTVDGGCFTITSEFTQQKGFNTQAATYSKRLLPYEGGFGQGLTGNTLTQAKLTALSDPNAATDATNIANLLAAFMNSVYLYNLTILWNTQIMGLSQVKSNSWLTVECFTCPGDWSLLDGTYETSASTAFQSYKALQFIGTQQP